MSPFGEGGQSTPLLERENRPCFFVSGIETATPLMTYEQLENKKAWPKNTFLHVLSLKNPYAAVHGPNSARSVVVMGWDVYRRIDSLGVACHVERSGDVFVTTFSLSLIHI